MSRPLRVQEAGLWHHVMNRGQGRRRVFWEDADRERFLELVGECAERWEVMCLAACLMDNHYHLLLRDVRGRLSRAMRHLDGVYTQRFNTRHGRDGALFRGRYRSRVVQRETYAVEVVRYIHANPVRAGRVRRAGQYRWSSHRHYLQRRRPAWLEAGEVLALGWRDTPAGRRQFDAFVHERVDADLARQVSARRWTPVLGDEGFVERLRGELRQRGVGGDREVVEGRRLCGLTAEEVVQAACAELGLSRRELVGGKRGERNMARLAAILICRDHTPARGGEIGAVFGVQAGTVSALASRAAALAKQDRELRRCVARLRDRLVERDA
jgi:REP element-mobilizing transposase RayT